MPHARKRRRPLRLGGVAEVADAPAISKSALADRRRTPNFPQPVAELACGPIWNLNDIDTYLQERDRDPFAAYRWDNQPGRWQRHFTRNPPAADEPGLVDLPTTRLRTTHPRRSMP